MRSAAATLRIGDLLDRRFAVLRGESDGSKLESTTALARVFQSEGTAYALIGGVAMQIWCDEPWSTSEIDVAVESCDDIPRAALEAAGFRRGRRLMGSESWMGPDGSPVLFTDDRAFAAAVRRPEKRKLGETVLHVAPVAELIRAKLRATDDPARRRSKRLLDFADAVALAEQHPSALRKLRAAERARLARA